MATDIFVPNTGPYSAVLADPTNPANAASIIGPGSDPVTIGPVTFYSIEVAGKLPIGSLEHKIVTKELIGGGRDTQSLGAQPKDVQWSGAFFQPTVDARVSALQAMAGDGKEYPLSWRAQRFYCKVKYFTTGFHNRNYCEYTISLTITRSANGTLTAPSVVSVDSQVSALSAGITQQNAIITAADPAGSTAFQQALTTLQSDLAIAGPIAQLAGPAAQNLLQDVGIALSGVQAYQQNLADGTPQFVAAQQLVSSLLLLQKNIAQGQSQNTVRVQGQSFFEIAATVYGDISQAYTLMQANKATSPFTSRQTPTYVTIPPLPRSS